MPSANTCLLCMEDGPVGQPASWHRVGAAFAARYPGRCKGCPGYYELGDRIQRWDKGSGATAQTAYTHAGCTP